MLSEQEKQAIIAAIEEEMSDLEKYQYLQTSKVVALNTVDYQIQVIVTRDPEEYIE